MADLSARWKAVLDVLRGEQVDATFCDLRLLATLIVAALDRLDAPCSECWGSGFVLHGTKNSQSTGPCPSCGTGNEEAT
jgi:hypothetical protein